MEYLYSFFLHLQNLDVIIRTGGYVALALIVFSETGLFFGFFLPGDSLLVTAGIFAARGNLDIFILLILLSACAILGDAMGFEIGKLSGRKIFEREHRYIKRRHLERTRAFYDKHGGKTIVLARFMPIVRTFAPLVAGMAGMRYAQFATFNVIGGIVWVSATVGLGYGLGRFIPDIDTYITPVILVVIFVSILPGIVSYLRTGHWKRWFNRWYLARRRKKNRL